MSSYQTRQLHRSILPVHNSCKQAAVRHACCTALFYLFTTAAGEQLSEAPILPLSPTWAGLMQLSRQSSYSTRPLHIRTCIIQTPTGHCTALQSALPMRNSFRWAAARNVSDHAPFHRDMMYISFARFYNLNCLVFEVIFKTIVWCRQTGRTGSAAVVRGWPPMLLSTESGPCSRQSSIQLRYTTNP